MIQVITEDGTLYRFTKKVIETSSFKLEGIIYHKVLTDEEIFMIPELIDGEIIMREKNESELLFEQEKVEKEIKLKTIENKIENEIKKIAINNLSGSGDLTKEDLELLIEIKDKDKTELEIEPDPILIIGK